MRIESLGLLPSKPTHNKQQATFNVGNSFEWATVIELTPTACYCVLSDYGATIKTSLLLFTRNSTTAVLPIAS